MRGPGYRLGGNGVGEFAAVFGEPDLDAGVAAAGLGTPRGGVFSGTAPHRRDATGGEGQGEIFEGAEKQPERGEEADVHG